MDERCDQIIHCEDKSDEDECALIVFEKSYNKLVSPFTVDYDEDGDEVIVPVKVFVSTSLRNILEISEFSHTIELKFGIMLEWYENRVQYHNLKRNQDLNVLSDSEVSCSMWMLEALAYIQVQTIWVPYIIFSNTDNDEAVTVRNSRTVVSVTRQGDFVRSGLEVTDEVWKSFNKHM